MIIRKADIAAKFLASASRQDKIASRVVAESAVDDICRIIRDEILAGHSVRISGLGTIRLKMHKARKARNIRTGEPIMVPPTIRASFELEPGAKAKLNTLTELPK